jgi:hypothetical protein
MNGQWLGTRKIRTNWATRKASTNETGNSTQNRGMNYIDLKEITTKRIHVKTKDIFLQKTIALNLKKKWKEIIQTIL